MANCKKSLGTVAVCGYYSYGKVFKPHEPSVEAEIIIENVAGKMIPKAIMHGKEYAVEVFTGQGADGKHRIRTDNFRGDYFRYENLARMLNEMECNYMNIITKLAEQLDKFP